MKLRFLLPLAWIAAGGAMAEGVRDIELRRLFEPTPAEIRAENAGSIYIYDGLRDLDVQRALEEEFDRVENMMFIRTKKTDAKGDVRRDEHTGAVESEDDGC
jgi:hypothetical protein